MFFNPIDFNLAEALADTLDIAHDELLTHGWNRGYLKNTDGELCTVGALQQAVFGMSGSDWTYGWQSGNIVQHLIKVLASQLDEYRSVFSWNDSRESADEVFDLLRTTAKKLRNGEITLDYMMPQEGIITIDGTFAINSNSTFNIAPMKLTSITYTSSTSFTTSALEEIYKHYKPVI